LFHILTEILLLASKRPETEHAGHGHLRPRRKSVGARQLQATTSGTSLAQAAGSSGTAAARAARPSMAVDCHGEQTARREAGGRVTRVKEVGDALVLLHTGTNGEKQGGGGSNGGGGAVQGRHTLSTCPAIEAFHRARVWQRCGQRGRQIWAASGSNLDMGRI